jgi:type IV secretory pathway VirB10-like protein
VEYPRLELKFGGKNKDRDPEIIEVAEFIGVKSYKARGKRLSKYEVKVIQELTPEGEQQPRPKEQLPDKPKDQQPDTGKTQTPAPGDDGKEIQNPEKETAAPEKKPAASEKKAAAPEKEPVSPDKKPASPDKKPAASEKKQKSAKKAASGVKAGPSKDSKQDPDEVPLEIVKPKEEKEDKGKKDTGGQFTLEW